MHAVDTSVFFRNLTGDDPAQAAKARRVIGQQPTVVTKAVMLEVEPLLRGGFDPAPEQVLPALRGLASLPEYRWRMMRLWPQPWIGLRRGWTLQTPCILPQRPSAKAS